MARGETPTHLDPSLDADQLAMPGSWRETEAIESVILAFVFQ